MSKPPRALGRHLSLLHRYGQIFCNSELAQLKISAGQLPFLVQLLQQDGVSQETLSLQLGLDKATTARALRRLEQLGYVERKLDRRDRRAYQVHVTRKAKKLRPTLWEVTSAWDALLLGGLGKKKQRRVCELLELLAENAERAIGELRD